MGKNIQRSKRGINTPVRGLLLGSVTVVGKAGVGLGFYMKSWWDGLEPDAGDGRWIGQ